VTPGGAAGDSPDGAGTTEKYPIRDNHHVNDDYGYGIVTKLRYNARVMDTSPTGSIVLLTRLARVVYRRSTVELVGLNLKQLGTLAFLRDHQSSTQQSLAEGLCIDANNCVLLLNEMEADGYLERRRDPSDRRRHLVEITPLGTKALAEAEHAQESIEDEVLLGLNQKERVAFRQLLSKALETLPPVVPES
jgi:DNA-binding MarR family transcriptional regulator